MTKVIKFLLNSNIYSHLLLSCNFFNKIFKGNEFSTLEGITFTWKINSGSRDVTGKNDVLRFINFKDSLYEIPKSIYNLDMQGLKGHLVLLEGIKTGTANVSIFRFINY